jgi:hypothetical protein
MGVAESGAGIESGAAFDAGANAGTGFGGQEKEESFEVWCFSAKEAQSGSAIPDPLSMTSMVSSPLSLILISIDENDTEIAEFRHESKRS